jgi:hypothetical protein
MLRVIQLHTFLLMTILLNQDRRLIPVINIHIE